MFDSRPRPSGAGAEPRQRDRECTVKPLVIVSLAGLVLAFSGFMGLIGGLVGLRRRWVSDVKNVWWRRNVGCMPILLCCYGLVATIMGIGVLLTN